MTKAWINKIYNADDCSYFLIWYTDENGNDRVFAENNKIQNFSTENNAKEKISKSGFEYQDTVFYDAERLNYWISTGRDHHTYLPFSEPKQIDCNFLLDFWNLFTDIAFSIDMKLEPVRTKRADKCYNKLFRGCHTAATTDTDYIPVFKRKDLEFIRELMNTGMQILKDNSEWQ